MWIWEPFLPSGPFIWTTPAQIRLLLAQLHLLEGHGESNQSEGKNLLLCNVVSLSVFYPVCCYMAAGIALRAAVWFLCTLTLMEGDCSVCKGRLQMGRLPLSLAPSLPGLLTSAVMTPDIRCTLSALSLWTYTQNRLLWFSVCLFVFTIQLKDPAFTDSVCICKDFF